MIEVTRKKKNEAIAIAISILLPGVGEVYLGEHSRGIAIFGMSIAIGIAVNVVDSSIGYWGTALIAIF